MRSSVPGEHPQTARLTRRQHAVASDAIRRRIESLRDAPAQLSGTSLIHGGDDRPLEMRTLARVYRHGLSKQLPYTLEVYPQEWPVVSRALRSTPQGKSLYQTLTRGTQARPPFFTFGADRHLQASERRMERHARPLGRPRRNWWR